MPTQISIGQGESRSQTSVYTSYYDEMVSAVGYGDSRPSIPEYPQIAHYIQEALDAVYYGTKSPKEGLDEAAAKSAIALG